MAEDDAEKVRKVERCETELKRIYGQVYPVLKAQAGRTDLPAHVLASIRNLDDPATISVQKAAAVLKALLGSTPKDKFALEHCYAAKMPDGKMVGAFVADSFRAVGVGYHDFWPYLRTHGWLKED